MQTQVWLGVVFMGKAFKFRIYPTKEQEILINKSIGCTRFVYNYFLDITNKDGYKSYAKYNKMLTSLKIEKPFLKEVDKFALQNSLRNLDDAFKRFFKGQNGKPTFKSKKHARKSYRTNFTNGNIEVGESYIKLPKLKKVKAKIHRQIEGKILNVTISKTPSGKYFASICCEVENKAKNILSSNTKLIGVDLGIKDYLITSEGEKTPNPKFLDKYYRLLVKAQRKLSRMEVGSNNFKKQSKKVAKIHEKIANSRRDFLHKLSLKLVSENQTIVAEGLKVKNMLKNPRLARHISDAAWGMFTNMLEYKANWYGRNFIKANTFFPSSQKCSSCGAINPKVKSLHIRKWECPHCNTPHDRDINAAINLKNEGIRLLTSKTCA